MAASLKPAYHIPLSPAELRLLGEICAIQGQIEWLMQECLFLLLDMNLGDVGVILGSTRFANNVDIWARIVRDKCDDKRVLAEVKAVVAAVAALTAGRNDFIHAIFVKWNDGWVGVAPRPLRGPGQIVAMRTRGGKITPISRVRVVRNAAAEISQQLLKIREAAFEVRLKMYGEHPPSPDRSQPQRRARRNKARPHSERVPANQLQSSPE
jgi:hypothetical protein